MDTRALRFTDFNDQYSYFDRSSTFNGPVEANNGRLERLGGSALGFRNLENDSRDHDSKPAASKSGLCGQAAPGIEGITDRSVRPKE